MIKTIVVATTATGDAEEYTEWQQWPLVRERYGTINEVACRTIRAFLGLGMEVHVISGDTGNEPARVLE